MATSSKYCEVTSSAVRGQILGSRGLVAIRHGPGPLISLNKWLRSRWGRRHELKWDVAKPSRPGRARLERRSVDKSLGGGNDAVTFFRRRDLRQDRSVTSAACSSPHSPVALGPCAWPLLSPPPQHPAFGSYRGIFLDSTCRINTIKPVATGRRPLHYPTADPTPAPFSSTQYWLGLWAWTKRPTPSTPSSRRCI